MKIISYLLYYGRTKNNSSLKLLENTSLSTRVARYIQIFNNKSIQSIIDLVALVIDNKYFRRKLIKRIKYCLQKITFEVIYVSVYYNFIRI